MEQGESTNLKKLKILFITSGHKTYFQIVLMNLLINLLFVILTNFGSLIIC